MYQTTNWRYKKLYKRLALRPNEIRILKLLPGSVGPIECTLRKAALKKNPSYVALSYMWGTKMGTGISVNGYFFHATLNLQTALERFRNKDQDVDIWVDAICIDQEAPVEKLKQLKLMRDIYSKAKETFVWLGAEAGESDKAVGLIKKLSRELKSCESKPAKTELAVRWGIPKTGDIKDELVALDDLFARDYWFRVWVVQEIAMSKNITLFCGEASSDWDEVYQAAYFLDAIVETKEIIREHRIYLSRKGRVNLLRMNETRRDWGSAPGGRDIQLAIQRIIHIQSVRNDMLREKTNLKAVEAEPPDSLLFLLSNHRSTEATYPPDKYLALAGLVDDDCISGAPLLEPKDPSVREIYIWAAQSIAKQQQKNVRGGLALDFLDCAGLPKKPLPRPNAKKEDEAKAEVLPSWLPDWSYNQRRAIPILLWQFSGKKDTDKVCFNAPGSGLTLPIDINSFSFSSPALGRLLAQGFKFDTIDGVGFSSWSSFDSSKVQNHKECQEDSTSQYPTGENLADVVWKTCVLNRSPRGLKPPPSWGDLFHAFNYKEQWHKENRKLKICGRTLEEITLDKMHDQNLKTGGVAQEDIAAEESARQQLISRYNSELLDLSTAIKIAFGRRRLAITELGYLCLAPFDARLGDVVAILYDCQAPVVLREESDHYKFIGTCYVHGIMQGEASKVVVPDSKEFNIL